MRNDGILATHSFTDPLLSEDHRHHPLLFGRGQVALRGNRCRAHQELGPRHLEARMYFNVILSDIHAGGVEQGDGYAQRYLGYLLAALSHLSPHVLDGKATPRMRNPRIVILLTYCRLNQRVLL